MSRSGRIKPVQRGRYTNALYAEMDHNQQNFANERQFRSKPHPPKRMLGENTYRILIKESKVKVVLGPKGKHVKDIEAKCAQHCKITIYTQHADGEPFPVSSPDRILNLECHPDELQSVLSDMIPHLQIAPPEMMMDKFNEIRLVVPEFVCSMIIGKKGVNVKDIQKELGSFVQVHKDPLPHSTEYIVKVTNRDVSSLALSAYRIYRSIQTIKSISHVTMFNPVEWQPGEFGDTGSYTEELKFRETIHKPEEHRYYREHPRSFEDNHIPTHQFEQRRGRYPDHGYNERGYHDMNNFGTSRARGHGQFMRPRGPRGGHRDMRPNRAMNEKQSPSQYYNRKQYREPDFQRENDRNSPVAIPRRPRGSGRGHQSSP